MRHWLGRARLPAIVWLACHNFACQGDERSPPAADPSVAPPEPGSLVEPNEPPTPATISPCGAATSRLEFVRPNLYFAIDASGSMTDGIPLGEGASYAPGTAPFSRYAALALSIQSLLARVGHRVNYGATLFPRGAETCDSGEEVRALGAGDDVSFALSGELGPELRSFMFSIRRRAPDGATPVSLTLEALAAPLAAAGPNTYVFLVTDGGPNCNPSLRCGPDACMPNLEQLRISDSLVCDDSLNCCDPSLFGSTNCLDTDGSLGAVRRLAAAGVQTIVIGMPGSEIYADVLDQLAIAGGAPRPQAPFYYRVGDAEALQATVSALGRTVAMSCTIRLSEPPPDPALVNLFFDGELVPSDPIDGWTFADARTVAIQGAACELIETGQVLQADVIAGCPIVIR
jgi:hypothetical protein